MTLEEMITINSSTEFLFKNEEGKKFWDISVAEAVEDYCCGEVIRCANYWAKYMQKLITEKNVTVAEIAELTFDEVNDICGGLSGLTYCSTVLLLSRSWKHGDELLKWHNGRSGYSGAGINVSASRKICF